MFQPCAFSIGAEKHAVTSLCCAASSYSVVIPQCLPQTHCDLCGKKHCLNISCASFSAITPAVMVSLVRPAKVTLRKQFMTVQGYRLCTCRTPLQQWLVCDFSVMVSSLHAVHSLPHRGLYCQVLIAWRVGLSQGERVMLWIYYVYHCYWSAMS